MENQKVRKIKRAFNVLALLNLIIAILSAILIVSVLITKETTVFGYISKDLIIIIDSLLLAYIWSKTTVTPIEETNDEK